MPSRLDGMYVPINKGFREVYMSEQEAVLSKVKKLLNMANHKNANEHESQSALLKAQMLLKKHGLAMKDAECGTTYKKEVVEENATDLSKTRWWKGRMANIICRNFRCENYYSMHGGYSQIMFLGLKEDVQLAKEVFNYAIDSMVYCANQATRKIKKEYGFTPRGYRNDYYTGYLAGLKAKFKEQVKKSDSLALIIVKDALVTEAYAKLHLSSMGRSSHASAHSSHAYSSGYTQGHSFNHGTKQLSY